MSTMTSHQSAVLRDDPLVAMARRTRADAHAFAQSVNRYAEEMPEKLDRFHVAMRDFRATAHNLRAGHFGHGQR